MPTCKTCGKTITPNAGDNPQRLAARKYCNRQCAATDKSKVAYEPRYCICCGDLIPMTQNDSPSHYNRRQYCNKSCQAKAGRSNPDAQFIRSVSQYLDEHAVEMEKAFCRVMPFPLKTLPPQVKRLWCPIKHKWYSALVGVLK